MSGKKEDPSAGRRSSIMRDNSSWSPVEIQQRKLGSAQNRGPGPMREEGRSTLIDEGPHQRIDYVDLSTPRQEPMEDKARQQSPIRRVLRQNDDFEFSESEEEKVEQPSAQE